MLTESMLIAIVLAGLAAEAQAAWIWVEGEKPVKSTMTKHPWYTQVKRDQLSGGDFLSHFDPGKPGEAEYAVNAPAAGAYEFWVRANPVAARLSYKLNGGAWTLIDLGQNQTDSVNIAADGKVDLRFIAWVKVGRVDLKAGANTISFRMDSENSNHGALDCFVFSTEPFRPVGTAKPDQVGRARQESRRGEQRLAGVRSEGRPVRRRGAAGPAQPEREGGRRGRPDRRQGRRVRPFQDRPAGAVLGRQRAAGERQGPRRPCGETARMLAKHGVNMVRVHGGYFNENGEVDPAKVQHAIAIVEEMKAEGIYTHFSIYFPLWLTPKPGTPWLPGYDGKKHPFAALYFNKDFQKVYEGWWKALLTTPSQKSGRRLADEPAVASLEIINEDSFFFWTFTADNVPDPELRIVETMFGDWLKKKYGSLDAAFGKWNGVKMPRDNPAEGRVGLRGLWEMFNQKTAARQGHRGLPAGGPARLLPGHRQVPARPGFQGPDHGLELGDGQPRGLRADREVQLHGGRFPRPPRLLRLRREGR